MAASASAIKAGEAVVSLNADDKKFQSTLDRVQRRFTNLGRTIGQLNNVMLAAGTGMAIGMRPVVGIFASFDDAMLAVKARTEATDAEFRMLTGTAERLGRTTSFTATQVAGLMGELGTMGFKPTEINEMTAAVLNLARATGVEAPFAGQMLGATMRQYGLDATKATATVDQLAKAVNASSLTLQGLAESLQYAGPVAADLELPIEDTLALAGALGNLGIQGSEAGTALRRLSLLSASAPDKMRSLFGVDTTDESGGLRNIVDILDDIQAAAKDMPNAERIAALTEAFGILGVTAASGLSKSTKSVRELSDQIRESGGYAQKVAEGMDSGIGGGLRRLQSAAEGAALAFGRSFAPVLGFVGKWMEYATGKLTEFLNRNSEMVTATAGTVVGILAVAAAVKVLSLTLAIAATPFTIVAGVLGTLLYLATDAADGMGELTEVLIGAGIAATALLVGVKLLGAAIAILSSPVGIVALGVGGLIALFMKLTTTGQKMAAGLVGFFKDIGRTFGTMLGGIINSMKKGQMELSWKMLTKGLETIWLTFVEGLQRAWVEFTLLIPRAFATALLEFVEMLNRTAAGFARLQGKAPEEKIIRQKAQPELTPIEQQVDVEKEYQRKERAKIDVLDVPLKARMEAFIKKNGDLRIGDLDKIDKERVNDDATIKALQGNIALSEARVKKLLTQWSDVWDKFSLGEKWIDPRPFQRAQGDLDQEVNDRSKKQREAKEKAQQELADLKALADAPDFAELAGNVLRLLEPLRGEAPSGERRPDVRPARTPTERLGDAVRGLYQSADFRGSLSIGPAAAASEKQLGKLTEMAVELKKQTTELQRVNTQLAGGICADSIRAC